MQVRSLLLTLFPLLARSGHCLPAQHMGGISLWQPAPVWVSR